MFVVNKEDKLYIYGAGAAGRKLANKLMLEGYKYIAFIDKYVSETELPVYTIKKYMEEVMEPSDIVIVTLNNGMAHDEIASQLNANGLTQILFLPMDETISISDKRKYRFAFMEFVIYYNFSVQIPFFKQREKNIINDKYNNNVSIMYPAARIYAGAVNEDESFFKTKVGKHLTKYYGNKAIDFKPYMELFTCLKEGKHDVKLVEEYMFISGRYDKKEKEQLLLDRVKLFEVYKNALINDMEFFYDSPIQCYQKNGKIYIRDGYHRFFFLYVMGFKEVPIVITKEELFEI